MSIKKLSSFSLVCLFIAVIGCKHFSKGEHQFYTTDFKKTKPISGVLKKLKSAHMPMDICVIPEKNLLLIIDINDTAWVKAYQLNDLKFIKSFIKKGAGPNDQMDCHKLQYDHELKYLYASDLNKRKIFSYAINDILDREKQVMPISDLTLEENNLYRPLLLKDGKWVDYAISESQSEKFVFRFFDSNGILLSKKGHFPKVDIEYKPMELKAAFEGAFSQSRDGKNIILSYFRTDQIDVYDNAGNLKIRVQGPDMFDTKMKAISRFKGTMIVPSKESKHAYSSPKMNNDSLYVLYNGKDGAIEEYHSSFLFAFRNRLAPEVIFQLTQPVFAFDLDWNKKTLYALTHKFGTNFIVKYIIP